MDILVIECSGFGGQLPLDQLRSRGHSVVCSKAEHMSALNLTSLDLVLLAGIDYRGLDACRAIRGRNWQEASLLVAIIDPEEPGAIQTAMDAGVDECWHGDLRPIQLNTRIASVERRIYQKKLCNKLHRESSEDRQRVKAIMDSSADGIIMVDELGFIQSFNQAAEGMFGYLEEEAVGHTVSKLMCPEFAETRQLLKCGGDNSASRNLAGITREVVGQRKDGSTFPMELSVSEVMLTGGRRQFIGLTRDMSERRAMEKESLQTSERERRRIGQDLHDDLGQMLAGITLILHNLTHTLEIEGSAYAQDISKVEALVKEADRHTRSLTRRLIPTELEGNELSEALQNLAQDSEQLFGIRCTFVHCGRRDLTDNVIATHLFRIAQEAISNAVRHGLAKRLRITLAVDDQWLRLCIDDDGRGFPDDVVETGKGFGLRIIGYRARMIGAGLQIGPGALGGTMLSCILELPSAQ